jgi:isoleucyl-tRNA synthetase
MLAIKGEISKAIEIARKAKIVGHPLDAVVELSANGKLRAQLEQNLETIKQLNIISDIKIADEVGPVTYESSELEGLKVSVAKAQGEKCQRCWMLSKTVGSNPQFPGLCDRCLKNLRP